MSDDMDVRLLLDGAAQGRGVVTEVIEKIGIKRASEILTHELLYRSCADELPAALPLLLVFEGSLGPVEQHIVVGNKDNDGAEQRRTVLRVDVVDAAMCLFGPGDTVAAPSMVLEWPDLWPDINAFLPDHVLSPAALDLGRRLTQTLGRRGETDLSRLSIRYQSDKWGAHRYTPLYEKHLAPYANRQVKVLEIGVGGGEITAGGSSLRMWKHFFPRGMVHGIDIVEKKSVDEQRISTHQVDQNDKDSLATFADEHGPFDIIVDDGSHYSSDIIASFHALFPHVAPGGMYVIEDLQTSYWSFFRGNHANFDDPKSSMGFLKQLVDGLNHTEILAASRRDGRPTDEWISGLHFYHNIAFVEKNGNREPSPLARVMEHMFTDADTGKPA